MEHLKYPIGKFKASESYSQTQRSENINELKEFPEKLKKLVSDLSETDLAKTYREGSWNIKQLVHHLGESHTNAYIRVKLALSEDNPSIKPYNENDWVHTKENELLPTSVSLQLIDAIHHKMVCLLENLNETQLLRTYFNPQYQRTSRICDLIALYSWHGKHHMAHIDLALASN